MKTRTPFRGHRQQRGAALIVVLVLLLIVTLLGLASLRGTLLEERMAANLYDRSLSFQTVEAALRDVEAQVSVSNALSLFPATGCSAGFCAKPVTVAGAAPRWLDPAFNGWATLAAFPATMTAKPQFFAEDMGEAPGWGGCDRQRPRHPQCMKRRFRITARSAADGRAQVILQSTFAAN